MYTPLRHALLGLTTLALAGSGALLAPSVAAPASPADSSAGYLAGLPVDGIVTSEYTLDGGATYNSYEDYGLSLDVYFALTALDTRSTTRDEILDALAPHIPDYTGSDPYEYAGQTGKLLAAVLYDLRNPATYGDGSLVGKLEGLVVDSGAEAGRGKDSFPEDDPNGADYSNTIGQAYVAASLSAVGSDEAANAVTFLLKQQCAKGFFRQSMDSADFTCDGGAGKPSVDATASAVVALRTILAFGVAPAGTSAAIKTAASDATTWLLHHQKRNGSFVGLGVANTNSTGLAASALYASGKTKKATAAAKWINSLRVTGKLVRTTPFKKRDLGAIAYSLADFATGKSDGITRDVRYSWNRATTQAAPVLILLG